MGIFREMNGTLKTLTTGVGGVTTFTTNEINLRGNVLAWHITFSAAAVTVALIGGIRVKMFGQPIVDLERDQLRAFLEYGNSSNFVNAVGNNSITIPMNLRSIHEARDLAAMDPINWRTAVAFPVTAAPQIEIIGASTTAFTTGSALLTWTYTDMPPTFYRRLNRSRMNFGAPNNNARYPMNTSGELRGLILPTIGVARARCVLNGIDAFQVAGRSYPGLTALPAGTDPWTESLRADNPVSIVTNPIYTPVPLGMPAGQGSYIEMDTAAAYATADVEDTTGEDQIVTDELVRITR